MQSRGKHLVAVALLLGFCISFAGCMKTKIITGNQTSNETVELPWAHGFIYGLVPPSNGPLEVGDQCENGVAQAYFRQTFIQGLAQGVTYSIYTPQRFTVTCASGGATSSLETPPSYLFRDNATSEIASTSESEAK